MHAVEHQKHLFRILVVQNFQKFSKSLKPFCRPFRQALAVGKQLCDFGFLGWQIQTARMLVHAVICVWFFPDHRRHSRHYSLHLVRGVDDFRGGGLCLFCCFVHIYNRQRYWLFFAGWKCTDSEYLFVGLMHDELFDPTIMQREESNE